LIMSAPRRIADDYSYRLALIVERLGSAIGSPTEKDQQAEGYLLHGDLLLILLPLGNECRTNRCEKRKQGIDQSLYGSPQPRLSYQVCKTVVSGDVAVGL
jgi:hypothetical protein